MAKTVHKLKVKLSSGKVVDYPFAKIKLVLAKAGYTGDMLLHATNGVFTEGRKLTAQGVLSVTDLEKAIFRAVGNTNKVLMNTAQQFARKILR